LSNEDEVERLLREDAREKARARPRGRGKKRPRHVVLLGDIIDRRREAGYRASGVRRSLLEGAARCPSCGRPFMKRGRRVYCSPRCAWREKARRRREKRRAAGLCPQCGRSMPECPPSKQKKRGSISYCETCRSRFRRYYERRKRLK